MPVYLDIQESSHFAEYLADQIRLYFTLHGFELANHTKWADGEVFEFRRDDRIISLLIRQADLENVRITIESEEDVDEVREVVEDALIQTVKSITEKVFEAYSGDPDRLRVRLIGHLQQMSHRDG